MKHRLKLVSLLLLSTAVPLTAGAAAPATKSERGGGKAAPALEVVDIPYEKFVLPNGLTLIVHEDRKTPVVSVGIWYHVGSANETEGRTGFAHLFEHLMFNGSQNADTDWFKAMNEVGATGMNGTTSFDRTNYYQTVPTAALDRVLWLESDRMENLLPAVDQAKLDEQRKVVQNEKRQRANIPLGEVPDMLYASTYPKGHPYSWTPLGSMEDLNAATLEDVGAFFKKWYGPGNAVLVLSGDISAQEAKQKVEHYFSSIPAGPALKRSSEQPARMTGETRGVIDVPTANSQLFKVWNIPGWASRDATLLDLASDALSNGENSRLHKRLVRELKLASEVEASLSLQELGSQFVISATARPGVSLAQLEAAINREMEGFLRDGMTAEEIARFKFQNYAGSVRGQASTMAKATTLAEGQLYAGSADHYRTRLKTIYDATPAQVLDVARKWLSDGFYVLEARALPSYAASGAAVDRSAPPAIGKAAGFDLPPLQHATLSNGMKVALAERHDVPTVNLSMIFDFGSLPDRDPASVGLSAAMGLTTTGTKTRSKLDISTEMQELGMFANWQDGNEFTRFSLNALKLKLDDSLDLYADILLNPVFPKDEWERLRDLFVTNYEENLKTPGGKLAQVMPRFVYGADHPYATQLTPDRAAKLTVDDFRGFYQKWVRPDLATIFVVGDTTMDEIVPKLEQRFRDWKTPAEAIPARPALPLPARASKPRVILLDQPGAESTLIGVAQPGLARNAPDYDVLSVVDVVMGGDFVSRLNMNLREDKGWSYGVRSELGEGVLLATTAVGGSVQADKTAAAMREIDRELREVGTTRPPSAEEIAAAKNAMLLGMPAALQGPAGAMSMYRDAYEYGLSEDYWKNYVSKIQGLTREQVDAAAKKLYRPNEMTWFVVGDLSKIETDVRQLGLGEVEVLDGDGRRLR